MLQLEVPAKTTSPEAVRSLIGELLGTDLGEGPAALVKADAERQPSIVILDNAHGFFLRRVGGLDGWQTLLGLTNARLANIFWLIVINNQSLAYPVSYTHLRAHETVLDLVCRLLLEKKKNITIKRRTTY